MGYGETSMETEECGTRTDQLVRGGAQRESRSRTQQLRQPASAAGEKSRTISKPRSEAGVWVVGQCYSIAAE